MKKFVFGAAISAAMSVSMAGSAFALTDAELNAILADVTAQCGATATLEQCDALVQAEIARLEADGLIDDAGRASAISKIVKAATDSLSASAGSNDQVSTEIAQIIGRATTSLNVIKARTPSAAAAVNSAVSNVTVNALVVVQSRGLSGTAAARTIGASLVTLSATSSNTAQRNAVASIGTKLNQGGSIIDMIDEIEEVNKNASPA